MPSALCYFCSVCDASYKSPAGWNRHLIKQKHLKPARLECHRWDDSVKDRVLVLFASHPIKESDSDIVEEFTSGFSLISDLVWWKARPKMAFLQLESREKVDEVIAKKGTSVMIDKVRLQMRRGSEYFDLEWAALLPVSFSEEDDDKNVAEEHAEDKEDEGDKNKNDKPIVVEKQPKTLLPLPLPISGPNTLLTLNGKAEVQPLPSLGKQFRKISQKMLFTKKKFETALRIKQLLEGLDFKKKVQIGEQNILPPPCKAIMFRNWYLGIKNMGGNELLFYFDYLGIWGEQEWSSTINGTPPIDGAPIANFLTRPERVCPVFQRVRTRTASKTSKQKEPFGNLYVDKEAGLKFRLVNSPILIAEAQTCLLLEHLCKFDARVHPFLMLVFYWAELNYVRFAYTTWTTEARRPFIAPEPSSLEWLAVLFLINQRIIPSVRDVMERKHRKLLLENIDVGFNNEDVQHLMEWSSNPSLSSSSIRCLLTKYASTQSEAFVLSLLQLLLDYFKFYSNLESCILNTKDGEVILTSQISVEPSPDTWSTKLTPKELKIIRNSHYVKNLDTFPCVLFHPFLGKWNFAFHSKNFLLNICPLMNLTSLRLQNFLEKGQCKTSLVEEILKVVH